MADEEKDQANEIYENVVKRGAHLNPQLKRRPVQCAHRCQGHPSMNLMMIVLFHQVAPRSRGVRARTGGAPAGRNLPRHQAPGVQRESREVPAVTSLVARSAKLERRLPCARPWQEGRTWDTTKR